MCKLRCNTSTGPNFNLLEQTVHNTDYNKANRDGSPNKSAPSRKIVVTYSTKSSISVCLFGWPIITQEPPDRFASNFDWGMEFGITTFLAWF